MFISVKSVPFLHIYVFLPPVYRYFCADGKTAVLFILGAKKC